MSVRVPATAAYLSVLRTTTASLAARLPATREAAGIAAYHAGEYATALIELRAARRMDGSPRYLPMIADSERGLGRPERAVAFLTDPAAGEPKKTNPPTPADAAGADAPRSENCSITIRSSEQKAFTPSSCSRT